MAERGAFGIPAREESASEQAIARLATGITAFVGRTLKGPLNDPAPIGSFAQFQRIFGGLWQPSTLSYAIEQYFLNGGRHAIVVRVVNGARPPTLALAGARGSLVLTGLHPGSREYLRAAVDYDGIEASEPDRFNLVVQRVSAPGSERIEDQEIWRRVSVESGTARFVTDVLLGSRLVRVLGAVPHERPAPTLGALTPIGYVGSNSDGDDGSPLSDYDVIGSALAATGLHALGAAPRFDLLCVPPLSRERDVNFSTLLVAARIARERHAMLVVDPPAGWGSVEAALSGLRTWPFRSENAVMFFPRLVAFDRLRKRPEVFASSAAGAALIARGDESWPVWAPTRGEDPILRPGLKPAMSVSEAERVRLANAGANALQSLRAGARPAPSLRTLAGGTGNSADWQHLGARRLASFVLASITEGMRWLASAPSTPDTWSRAQRQVRAFLEALAREGAFASAMSEESYFVFCDDRVNRDASASTTPVNLVFGFATTRPGEYHAWMLSYQAGRARLRPIAVNRLTTSASRVESEIESSILSSQPGAT